jgi:hypothetical protein
MVTSTLIMKREILLEAYGIVTKYQKLPDVLKSKQCPNYNEAKRPDSKFRGHCSMALTYDPYNRIIEDNQVKDKEEEGIYAGSIA